MKSKLQFLLSMVVAGSFGYSLHSGDYTFNLIVFVLCITVDLITWGE